MNNFIEYFYGIKVNKILFEDKYYSFIYNEYIYRLYIYDNTVDLNFLYDINKKLVRNTLMNEIIINRNNEVISTYNGISYILMKLFINVNKKISLDEIVSISNSFYIEKAGINWGILWEKKIDYLEDLINENGKKYPLIVDSFNYFVGLAENAISYFNSIVTNDNYKCIISHRMIRWNDNIDVLYNPLNIIYDYRVRDIAEYIKNSFFNDNYNIFNELMLYLQNNWLNVSEVKLLIARVIYPSFYFDMYEDILIDNKEEKIILDIINKLAEYEDYINRIIQFFRVNYDIEEIDWLKKRRF